MHAGSCSPRCPPSRPPRASRRPLLPAPPFLRRPRWRRRWTSGTASCSGSWRASPGRPRRPPWRSRTRCWSSTSGCATATRRCSGCGRRISWRERQAPRRGGGGGRAAVAGSLPGQPGPALSGLRLVPGGLWERTLGLRRDRTELGVRGAEPGAPRLPQSTFSMETFIPERPGPFQPRLRRRLRPGMGGRLLERLSLNPCLPFPFPGKTDPSLLTLTIRFNTDTNNFK